MQFSIIAAMSLAALTIAYCTAQADAYAKCLLLHSQETCFTTLQ